MIKKKRKRKPKSKHSKDNPSILKTKEALKDIGVKLHHYKIEFPDEWKMSMLNLYLLGFNKHDIARMVAKRLNSELRKRGVKKPEGKCNRIANRRNVVAYNLRKIAGKDRFKTTIEGKVKGLDYLRRVNARSSNNKT